MPQRLLNKVAVVIGADAGIGRAVAERFAAEGAKVVAAGERRDLLDEVARRAPARVLAIAVDATRPVDLEQLATASVRRFGRVDVLVPAAGTVRLMSVAESTPEAVQELFTINFLSVQQTVRLFLPHLNRGASVVFVTGELAGRSGVSVYNASKAAVRALARSLAVELAPRAIRANCLAPEAMSVAPGADEDPAAGLDEVAEAAVFLASDAARGLTGQELVIGAGPRPLQ